MTEESVAKIIETATRDADKLLYVICRHFSCLETLFKAIFVVSKPCRLSEFKLNRALLISKDRRVV